MGIAAFISILLALLLNIFEGITHVLGIINDTSYLPTFLGKTISILQVFFPLLAMVFSLVNCFTNKKTTKLLKFLTLAVSAALFFANLNWLISWFI